MGAAALAVIVAVGALVVSTRGETVVGVDGAVAMDAGPSGRVDTRSAAPAGSRDLVVVDVGGAVVRPGVYRLPAGSRIGDAIEAAGGFATTVDAALAERELNLAAPLADGTQVHVPARGEAEAVPASSGAPAGGAAGGTSAGPVNLNTATAEELDTLPGVGPATAAKIIAARETGPFASVDDLLTRKAVGPATLEKLRPLVTVGP